MKRSKEIGRATRKPPYSHWNVYWWKAGNQFVVGDSWQIVDLMGRCFTRRYTASRRPKTLVLISSLETFLNRADAIMKSAWAYRG